MCVCLFSESENLCVIRDDSKINNFEKIEEKKNIQLNLGQTVYLRLRLLLFFSLIKNFKKK